VNPSARPSELGRRETHTTAKPDADGQLGRRETHTTDGRLADGRLGRRQTRTSAKPDPDGRLGRQQTHDESTVLEMLRDVHDPEIPTVSLVELGIVHRVEVGPDRIAVELLPTFTGCPALEVMRADVEARLSGLAQTVDVRFTTAVPWTSDRISGIGRAQLRSAGFAPPDPEVFEVGATVACPYCGSGRTRMENAFGPTLCRSIWYCTACRQPFEQFKSV